MSPSETLKIFLEKFDYSTLRAVKGEYGNYADPESAGKFIAAFHTYFMDRKAEENDGNSNVILNLLLGKIAESERIYYGKVYDQGLNDAEHYKNKAQFLEGREPAAGKLLERFQFMLLGFGGMAPTKWYYPLFIDQFKRTFYTEEPTLKRSRETIVPLRGRGLNFDGEEPPARRLKLDLPPVSLFTDSDEGDDGPEAAAQNLKSGSVVAHYHH